MAFVTPSSSPCTPSPLGSVPVSPTSSPSSPTRPPATPSPHTTLPSTFASTASSSPRFEHRDVARVRASLSVASAELGEAALAFARTSHPHLHRHHHHHHHHHQPSLVPQLHSLTNTHAHSHGILPSQSSTPFRYASHADSSATAASPSLLGAFVVAGPTSHRAFLPMIMRDAAWRPVGRTGGVAARAL